MSTSLKVSVNKIDSKYIPFSVVSEEAANEDPVWKEISRLYKDRSIMYNFKAMLLNRAKTADRIDFDLSAYSIQSLFEEEVNLRADNRMITQEDANLILDTCLSQGFLKCLRAPRKRNAFQDEGKLSGTYALADRKALKLLKIDPDKLAVLSTEPKDIHKEKTLDDYREEWLDLQNRIVKIQNEHRVLNPVVSLRNKADIAESYAILEEKNVRIRKSNRIFNDFRRLNYIRLAKLRDSIKFSRKLDEQIYCVFLEGKTMQEIEDFLQFLYQRKQIPREQALSASQISKVIGNILIQTLSKSSR